MVTYRLHGSNESITMPLNEFIEKLKNNINKKEISYNLQINNFKSYLSFFVFLKGNL